MEDDGLKDDREIREFKERNRWKIDRWLDGSTETERECEQTKIYRPRCLK